MRLLLWILQPDPLERSPHKIIVVVTGTRAVLDLDCFHPSLFQYGDPCVTSDENASNFRNKHEPLREVHWLLGYPVKSIEVTAFCLAGVRNLPDCTSQRLQREDQMRQLGRGISIGCERS